ncbi:MAG: hypothetical protein WCX73_03060 [Candidatus Pacearchaeota archaeon]|jgi:hypothetical protein
MPCEDCVGMNNCSKYQSLIQTIPQGRSVADVVYDSSSCIRGYNCTQTIDADRPYRGE